MLKNCTLITIQKYDNGQNQINNDMCILAHWYQLQKKKKNLSTHCAFLHQALGKEGTY